MTTVNKRILSNKKLSDPKNNEWMKADKKSHKNRNERERKKVKKKVNERQWGTDPQIYSCTKAKKTLKS